jgi:hypothetical protein
MPDLPNVNALEIETFKTISQGTADGPVFMLNLNKYRVEARYPDGQLYKDYMAVLDSLLLQVVGRFSGARRYSAMSSATRTSMRLWASGTRAIRHSSI